MTDNVAMNEAAGTDKPIENLITDNVESLQIVDMKAIQIDTNKVRIVK